MTKTSDFTKLFQKCQKQAITSSNRGEGEEPDFQGCHIFKMAISSFKQNITKHAKKKKKKKETTGKCDQYTGGKIGTVPEQVQMN